MNLLGEWTAAACAELGVDAEDVDRATVLAIARDSARSVARPAAPLTAYLLGVAVGRGVPVKEAADRLAKLMASWPRIDWRD
ncbi:DUF6457 domain-containing protein [Amycolatopsis suaedae]|uniref:DUF6457 domain-containing protein n=1 Tax=Amycolatopsis suaedae TaxID=2510978 RepID=UPI0013EF44E8|nr:DUF6457 domain-containing protein [Amycolatopsis suaedae]